MTANGTLEGDLVLVASSDPNLSGRIRDDDNWRSKTKIILTTRTQLLALCPVTPPLVIRKLAQQVANAHIKKIRGHVLIDVSLFPEGERELGTGVVISHVVVQIPTLRNG